jgi:transposase
LGGYLAFTKRVFMLTKVLPCFKYLQFESVTPTDGQIVITAVTTQPTAACALCHQHSQWVHAHYQRTVADLPLAGAPVVLHIRARKFFCRVPACPRRIFTERLAAFAAPQARRSHGLRAALRRVAVALGGEAGARLATALAMPTSPDTLLRLIRSLPRAPPRDPCIIGLDEWAWRKGVRYGTMIVDLERHRVAALLPDRDAEQVAAWLAAYPSITVVSRDRSATYADAATRGAPQAIQVADRFHVIRNLSEALEKFLLHKRAHLKEAAAITAAALAPPPAVPGGVEETYPGKHTSTRPQLWQQRAEEESRRTHERYVAAYPAGQDLHAKGADIADIARRVGVSRRTVYRYLSLDGPPARKRPVRRPSPERLAWEAYIVRRWEDGCRNGRRLWREARAAGFKCGERNAARFVARLRQQDPQRRPTSTSSQAVTSVQGPTARHVSLLFLRRPTSLTADQALYLKHLCQGDEDLSTAYAMAQDFAAMLRERDGAHLDSWIEAACDSGIPEVRRFALGLKEAYAAVRAGLTLAYSNGQTGGQIHRLKLVRRSMYGRGKFDLLERRVVQAA